MCCCASAVARLRLKPNPFDRFPRRSPSDSSRFLDPTSKVCQPPVAVKSAAETRNFAHTYPQQDYVFYQATLGNIEPLSFVAGFIGWGQAIQDVCGTA